MKTYVANHLFLSSANPDAPKAEQKITFHIANDITLPADTFEPAYFVLGCELIEVVTLPLDGHEIQIFADETARLNNAPFVLGFAITDDDGRVWPIAGGMLIASNCNKDTPFDAQNIRDLARDGRIRPMFVPTLN